MLITEYSETIHRRRKVVHYISFPNIYSSLVVQCSLNVFAESMAIAKYQLRIKKGINAHSSRKCSAVKANLSLERILKDRPKRKMHSLTDSARDYAAESLPAGPIGRTMTDTISTMLLADKTSYKPAPTFST